MSYKKITYKGKQYIVRIYHRKPPYYGLVANVVKEVRKKASKKKKGKSIVSIPIPRLKPRRKRRRK